MTFIVKILFIGDISGRSGRKLIKQILPQIKSKYKPDLVIANCENAAGGLGVTREILNELTAYGIDFFTSGDHVWYIKDFVPELHDVSLPIVRPYNYEKTEKLPGSGYRVLDLGKEGKLMVVNLLGQSFMRDHARSPFWTMDELLEQYQDQKDLNILVDFHAETTAEKLCLAGYLKDRVSAVLGTHTHVPTCDNMVLPKGTLYITDIGMCGAIDSSLGVKADITIKMFLTAMNQHFEWESAGRKAFRSVLLDLQAKTIVRIDKII